MYVLAPCYWHGLLVYELMIFENYRSGYKVDIINRSFMCRKPHNNKVTTSSLLG